MFSSKKILDENIQKKIRGENRRFHSLRFEGTGRPVILSLKVNKKFQRAEAKRKNNHVGTIPSSRKTKHQRGAMSKDLLSRNKINQQVQNQINKSKASESSGNRLNHFKTVL